MLCGAQSFDKNASFLQSLEAPEMITERLEKTREFAETAGYKI